MKSFIQPGVELQELHSHILDQDLQLYIKLPWTYKRTDTVYPVLFSLDGNRSFPLYSTTSLIYETPGTDSPEIVIVGIGYKLDEDRLKGLAKWAAWRTRDLTPVRKKEVEAYWKERLSALLDGEAMVVQSGGAMLFLRSLSEEIIPSIESHYRVSSTDRGLAGFSYGGLFTLYTLFHAPEMFSCYFTGSPTMWEELFEYEREYAISHDDIHARVLMTAGAHEPHTLDSVERMAAQLQSRKYPGLELFTHVFEDLGHASSYAAAVSRALGILYNPLWLKK